MAGKAAIGFASSVGQTMFARIFSFAAQFAIAYALTPEDFGRVALSLTVVSLTSILLSSGLSEVLLNRQKALRGWTSTAERVALYLGGFSGLLTLLLSPLAAMFYRDWHLISMGLMYALSQLIQSFSTVPTAKLQKDLRFVALARINVVSTSASSIALVLAAFANCGAYSFPISRLVMTASSAYLCRSLIGWRSISRHRPRLGWYLFSQLYVFLLISLTASVSQQVDYFALRWFHSAAEVGIYYFAFSIAGNTSQLIGGSVTAVVHPVLSNINRDPARRVEAAVRLMRMVTAIGYPLAFIQAACVGMIFHQALPPKWLPATEATQILSIGLGANMVSGVCWGLLKVQNQAKWLLGLNVVSIVLFSIGCFIVSKFFDSKAIAILAAIYCLIYTQALALLTGRLMNYGDYQALRLVTLPFLVCLAYVALLYTMLGYGLETRLGSLPHLIACSILYFGLCFSTLVAVQPKMFLEIWRYLRVKKRADQLG